MKQLVQYFFKENNQDDILKDLGKELVKINQRYPYINWGGCGVFAERLYDRLKLLGFKPKIVVLVWSKQCFAESIKMLAEKGIDYYWINRTEGFPHIAIKVNGCYIDSEGIYKTKKELLNSWKTYVLYEKGMNINHLRMCTADERFWNDKFDRRDIPAITKKLDNIYKKISKKINQNSLVVS